MRKMQAQLLLNSFHLLLAVVHLTTSVLHFVFPVQFSIPVGVARFVRVDNSTATDVPMAVALSIPHHNNPQLHYLSAMFLFLAFLDHTILYFVSGVIDRAHVLRWYEYSASASLMNAEIAILCGVHDPVMIVNIVFFTMFTMLLGIRTDYDDDDDKDSSGVQLSAWLLFALAWLPICVQFFSAEYTPDFVKVLFVVMIVLESLFGVWAAVWRRCTGPIGREFGYCVLSLVAKQSLAWIVYQGAKNRPPLHLSD